MQSASVRFGPITATTAAFQWAGGNTCFNAVGTFGLTAEINLQQRGPDNVTWIEISSKTAPGHSTIQLSPGEYRIEIVNTVTDGYVELARVPI